MNIIIKISKETDNNKFEVTLTGDDNLTKDEIENLSESIEALLDKLIEKYKQTQQIASDPSWNFMFPIPDGCYKEFGNNLIQR